MRYYALQVHVGSEGKFLAAARHAAEVPEGAVIWPRRRLRIRKKGTWRETLASVFPGYLFVRADTVAGELFTRLRSQPGFIRFLPSNDSIRALGDRDQATLSHFMAFGEIVDRSVLTFDERHRIRVVSGPLRGLEGRIVGLDRRKGRARVRLELYEDSFEIDFGFQSLEAAEAAERAADGVPDQAAG
jgi:transcription termination/antitermination protein NusG